MMMNAESRVLRKCFVILTAVVAGVVLQSGMPYDDVLTAAEEKEALDEFKAAVIPHIPETSAVHDYINDDLYFVQWLRASGWSPEAAEEMFLNHLSWRASENIDGIMEENWSYFQRNYPVYSDTFDKDGRPASEIWFGGDYDVSSAVASRQGQRLLRWMSRMMELNTRQLYDLRAQGRNVSEAVILADINGFGVFKQGCPGCLALYASFIKMWQANYPRLYGDAYLVAVPRSFDIVLRIIQPLYTPYTSSVIKTYPSGWQPVLDSKFEKSQRSVRFGGSKLRE